MAARSVLVTGGVRSGKSTHAERLLTDVGPVVYVAPGPTPDVEQDPDWSARIKAHRARRPADWETVEGHDLVAALGQGSGRPMLIDCLGTWLTSTLDAAQAWEAPSDELHDLALGEIDRVTVALASHDARWVVVTNEVGLGVIPSHRSGRVFRDLLGTVNQKVGAVCDEVHLVVAGRVLVL